MKFRWFLIPVGFIAITLSAQTIDVPNGGTTIFSTQTLTNVYTASSVVDVQSFDSIGVIASTVTTQALAIANIKPQWSHDTNTWSDVSVLQSNAIASLETPYTITSKQVTMSLTNGAPNYVEVYPRNARYFRVMVKSTNDFTSGTLKIVVQKMNNGGRQ